MIGAPQLVPAPALNQTTPSPTRQIDSTVSRYPTRTPEPRSVPTTTPGNDYYSGNWVEIEGLVAAIHGESSSFEVEVHESEGLGRLTNLRTVVVTHPPAGRIVARLELGAYVEVEGYYEVQSNTPRRGVRGIV